MRFEKNTLCLVAIVLAGMHGQASASIVAKFNVFSTSVVNAQDVDGADAPHGLWISTDAPGLLGESRSGGNFFDILPGTTLTQFSDGTAELTGSAENPYGDVAIINLTLSGFEDELPSGASYKQEGGAAYTPATQDFYSQIGGSITIGGEVVTIDQLVSPYLFQLGLGANAKDPNEFGASAWIQEGTGSNFQDAHHWDLNLTLEAVPEPTTLVVWSFLLSGVCAVVRFNKRIAA